jgi:hypothetical protein
MRGVCLSLWRAQGDLAYIKAAGSDPKSVVTSEKAAKGE